MKKRESLINGMGKIDDSILERYDKIDADIDERKTKLPRKRRIGAISLIASAAAILLAVTPFAVKKLGLFSYFPLGQVTGSTPAEGSTPESIPDNPPIETEIWVDDLGYALNEDGNSYTLVGYRGEAVDIAVHETVNGLNVTHIGANAFARNEELSSVTLPDSIQVIGEYAFDGCKSLKNVNMGNGVKEIRENAFHRCTSLKEIEIPYGVVEIEQFAFFYCESLEEIVIPESVTSLGYSAFQNCSSLRRAVIPGSVKTVPTTLFQECYSLSWVTLSEGITEIGNYAFTKCSSLMTVVLPESLEKIEMGAFNECSRLSSINIPNGIAEIKGYTFSQCKRLTEIVIPNSVSIIGESAFQKCTSLEGISIPDGVTGISESAFDGCTRLHAVTVPNSLQIIDEKAFANCPNLRYLIFEGTREEWDAVRKDVLWKMGSGILEVYTDGEIPPNADSETVMHQFDYVCRELGVFDDDQDHIRYYYGKVNAGYVFEIFTPPGSYWEGFRSLLIGDYAFGGFTGPVDGNSLVLYDGESITAASVAYENGLISDEELDGIFYQWMEFAVVEYFGLRYGETYELVGFEAIFETKEKAAYLMLIEPADPLNPPPSSTLKIGKYEFADYGKNAIVCIIKNQKHGFGGEPFADFEYAYDWGKIHDGDVEEIHRYWNLWPEYGAVAEYLVEEDGKLYLVLPISQTKVYAEHCKEHLYKVKLEDLASADEALSREITKYTNSAIDLSYDGHYLTINFEAIVPIDPPNTQDGLDSGCGIDHDHVYQSFPIAADPLD